MLLLWQGDDQAAGQFLIADEVTRAVGIREPCHLQWQGHAIAAHLAANRTDDAQRVIDWLESCARSLPCRWPRIAATLGRAQLAAREGDLDAADTMFRTAMALHAETELPLHRVEALLAYGAFLRRTGHPTDARPLLADAQLTAVRTGAGRLAETAHSELALAGGRRRGALTDRDELTAAEVRVAELAAAGRSNAEIARQLFLSVNTVETHLKHVYAKLRIRSRRDLMARRTDPESALG
jgi:DNA-binding CsgD family transcriptional regulator